MKIRTGFVSNSSSSSFTCCISGEDYSGWDACLCDADMIECRNGHTMLTKYAKEFAKEKIKTKEDFLKYTDERDNDYYKDEIEDMIEDGEKWGGWHLQLLSYYQLVDDGEYDWPTDLCPVCQRTHILENDFLAYVIKKYDIDVDAIEKEMRDEIS